MTTIATDTASLDRIFREICLQWAPPTKLTVSQWADAHRILSPESSAAVGRWETARAEFQRGVMDAVSDPDVEEVVIMSSVQIGKTEIISNVIGDGIDNDPSPMLLVEPTLEIAHAYSKDRLAPMIRDTARLRGKVRDVKSRDSGNTLLHKIFPGGHITLAGANSPASLSSRPVRRVLCDEVDRFPVSAGAEGDPVSLAKNRSVTFWNRKIVLASTPTIKGRSRIESAYEASDKRKYWVPCPHCQTFQILKWCQVRWPSPSGEGKWKAEAHRPEDAVYLCESCGAELTHADKQNMVAKGEWRADAQFKGIAGFWINALYSPWMTVAAIAQQFLAAKAGGPLQLQVFTNTILAETWAEHAAESLDENIFYHRREQYAAQVPAGAAVLTAGVDVQEDRIECEVRGWGRGEESWGIEKKVFFGPTTDPNGGAWQSLDEYLPTTFLHASGIRLPIACTCIDTGFRTKEAYAFIRPRQGRRIFAVKGSKDRGKPIVSRPTKSGVSAVFLFEVGTDTAKTTIHARLRTAEPGPGYLHFPMTYDLDHFEQLTAEKQVTTFRKGYRQVEWVKEPNSRNEALDLTVYNLAALAILNPNLDALAAGLDQHQPGLPPEPPPEAKRPRNTWVNPRSDTSAPPHRGRGRWVRR